LANDGLCIDGAFLCQYHSDSGVASPREVLSVNQEL
jgi:hypothetical protein